MKHDNGGNVSSKRWVDMEHFNLEGRLHTDVLKDRYGPISPRGIYHDEHIRKCHLVDGEDISRTYAMTILSKDDYNNELATVDKKIREGGSMGITFRDYGYKIRKNVIDVYAIKLPEWLQKDFKVDDEFAKVRLTEFCAKRGNFPYNIYGTIAEIYSSDFRDPLINGVDVSQINPTTEALEKKGITRNYIWSQLNKDNPWSGVEIEPIIIDSLPHLFNLRKEFNDELAKQIDL